VVSKEFPWASSFVALLNYGDGSRAATAVTNSRICAMTTEAESASRSVTSRSAALKRRLETDSLRTGGNNRHVVVLGLAQQPRSFVLAPYEFLRARVAQLCSKDDEGGQQLLAVSMKPGGELAGPWRRHPPTLAGRAVVSLRTRRCVPTGDDPFGSLDDEGRLAAD
jgi:hypothetical protein